MDTYLLPYTMQTLVQLGNRNQLQKLSFLTSLNLQCHNLGSIAFLLEFAELVVF